MAVTETFTNQAKLDFLQGIHAAADTYKCALYTQAAATLDKTSTTYSTTGETDAKATPRGVEAVASIGDVAPSATSSARVMAAGVQASTALGNVIAFIPSTSPTSPTPPTSFENDENDALTLILALAMAA